jgi:hypothetical protein
VKNLPFTFDSSQRLAAYFQNHHYTLYAIEIIIMSLLHGKNSRFLLPTQKCFFCCNKILLATMDLKGCLETHILIQLFDEITGTS